MNDSKPFRVKFGADCAYCGRRVHLGHLGKLNEDKKLCHEICPPPTPEEWAAGRQRLAQARAALEQGTKNDDPQPG